MATEETHAQKLIEQMKPTGSLEPDTVTKQDLLPHKMQQEKDKFLKKHAISQHHGQTIDSSMGKMQLSTSNVVSLPRKRAASDDLDGQADEVALKKPEKKRQRKQR